MAFTVSPPVIVIASCQTIGESLAMARWIVPALEEWPRTAWLAWCYDASNRSGVRAAPTGVSEAPLDWQSVDVSDFAPEGIVCKTFGGKPGFAVLTHEPIAQKVVRGLEGLVADILTITAGNPLALPFKRSFASLGVRAGL